jgi:hypothetical protein
MRGVFILLLFVFSCSRNVPETQSGFEMAVEDLLFSQIFFIPVENLEYLENIHKKKLASECGIDIDSIKSAHSVAGKFGITKISKEKTRSIYRRAIELCMNEQALQIAYKNDQNISDWGMSVFREAYGDIICSNKPERFDPGLLKGTPFRFYYEDAIDEKIKKKIDPGIPALCGRYLKISLAVECGNYKLIELSFGCGAIGEQKQLYVLEKYYGKWYIEDKFKTEYVY